MSKLKVTNANVIHAAFTLRREDDIREKERRDAEIEQCKEDIKSLANDILRNDQWLKLGAVNPHSNVSLARKGYSGSYRYFLVWDSGDHKEYKLCDSSGRVRLKGNARRRAVRAFNKLSKLKVQQRRALSNARDWQSRKRNLINQRIRDRPDILAKMKALCEEALVSPTKQ